MPIVATFLLALLCSFGASALNVFLSWLLLFRSAAVRLQISSLEKRQKALEDLKSKGEDESDKTHAKKIKKTEEDISVTTRELKGKNLKYTIVSGVLLLVLNRLMRSGFDGVVVAKLPFEPFPLLTRMTHSSLETEDLRDGSFQVVYWLGTLLFRDIFNRSFGFQLPHLNLGQAFKMPQ
jgi:hypothetical protein